ncbi:sushi, von Willebrand factor type A, EGF and pentraxin domain-containing protein 1 isoform X2 [Octopus bimaculoides]|uniref:sushi, von Willebrand factor type A, EGF and pentraxin domain-containing protein 1 isoform X2 n=1 Tax=Octopus bimaculoides TaxID=37653 RepID=UPI00071C331E|nr:sushi, von Willebrand factor type A, EGF and pentraxin domain-containing protein 1 isoform X2 [Octopus bimaculoides]|eukprot:XP_014773591.1 PREDICTED: sushi, von Willebrand factor type A, EGF and pentraxin domain-containing protein 1-like isoform X2 [Octopus bimaculoides]
MPSNRVKFSLTKPALLYSMTSIKPWLPTFKSLLLGPLQPLLNGQLVKILLLLVIVQISTCLRVCLTLKEISDSQNWDTFFETYSLPREECENLCVRRSACHSFSYDSEDNRCKLSSKNPTADYENITIITSSPCIYRPCAADEMCVNANRSGHFCFPLDIDCGYPLQYRNMLHDVPSTKYSNEVQYFCKVGYRFTEGENTSTCLLSGKWSAVPAECQQIECGTPAVIPNTTMVVDGAAIDPSDVPHTYLSQVTYRCLEDYVKINGSVTSTCQLDSHWAAATIQCLYVKCADPPRLPDTTLSLNGESVAPSEVPGKFNTRVTYNCSEYNVYRSGSTSSVCQLNSTWSNVSIQCLYVKCGRPPKITDAEFQVNGKSTSRTDVPDKYNSRVTYKCKDGFNYADGPQTSECRLDSKWSKVIMVCSRTDG